jgi:hypothetical protein
MLQSTSDKRKWLQQMKTIHKIQSSHSSDNLEGCPKSFATLSILQSIQQKMSAIYSVVNFASSDCYCSAMEQGIFLPMFRESLTLSDRAWY